MYCSSLLLDRSEPTGKQVECVIVDRGPALQLKVTGTLETADASTRCGLPRRILEMIRKLLSSFLSIRFCTR